MGVGAAHGARPWICFNLLIVLLLSACSGAPAEVEQPGSAEPAVAAAAASAESLPPAPAPGTGKTDDSNQVTEPTATAEATGTPAGREGREGQGAMNPLTGLPVEEAATLCRRPVLVAVSNFPASSRPQAGLSFAAQVWETYIGQGMTRYLAVYYGDYMQRLDGALENALAAGYAIGPVRSGRVVFEDIKALFPKAILITAGASAEVKAQLTNRSSVYAADPEDINSAGLGVERLRQLECAVVPEMYTGLTFGAPPPAGGEPADFFRLVYNLFNQVGWEYDPGRGAYLRQQDRADGTGELAPSVERLTGEPLAFENVLVLWAQHRYIAPAIIEMELVYVRDRFGLLFRDGQVFKVRWSTLGGKLELHDDQGLPVPLKPGSSFFEAVSYQTTWDADNFVVRYHNPPTAGD